MFRRARRISSVQDDGLGIAMTAVAVVLILAGLVAGLWSITEFAAAKTIPQQLVVLALVLSGCAAATLLMPLPELRAMPPDRPTVAPARRP